jgi:hypothetical protein
MNDDELHRLLRQHPARVPLAASFDREVWSRIEAESTRTLGSLVAELFERTLAHFARPPLCPSSNGGSHAGCVYSERPRHRLELASP